MTVLAGIGFASPWLLLGLLALPVLWIILRAVPPAPIRRMFPGVALLLGLKDDESVSDRTPWWLLLLRMLAVAAVIVGLAGPVLNPNQAQTGSGPLLIVLDASWAGAAHWSDKTDLGAAGRSRTCRSDGRNSPVKRSGRHRFSGCRYLALSFARSDPCPLVPYRAASGAIGRDFRTDIGRLRHALVQRRPVLCGTQRIDSGAAKTRRSKGLSG